MPTPTGLLKKGDRLIHLETGMIFTVTERTGKDLTYSVYLTPVPPRVTPAYERPNEWLMLEAHYWLGRTYEIINEDGGYPVRYPLSTANRHLHFTSQKGVVCDWCKQVQV